MARPTNKIVVWAAQDVNLPGTGRPNKSKPIDDLLAKGYDKGQKPAAEEFNYILNMSSGWLEWIVDEKFPEVEAEFNRLISELEARIGYIDSMIQQNGSISCSQDMISISSPLNLYFMRLSGHGSSFPSR